MRFLNSEWASRIRSDVFEFGVRFWNLEWGSRIWSEVQEFGVGFRIRIVVWHSECTCGPPYSKKLCHLPLKNAFCNHEITISKNVFIFWALTCYFKLFSFLRNNLAWQKPDKKIAIYRLCISICQSRTLKNFYWVKSEICRQVKGMVFSLFVIQFHPLDQRYVNLSLKKAQYR